jgi:hypothetical protein
MTLVPACGTPELNSETYILIVDECRNPGHDG